ncbi:MULTISPECIES: hypothetical protein [unclassified Micromonospora]|uniref:hypothetical protein n=1 Tax=unclassified Micromonospora TaxID=2617518 RepID=UPI00331BC93F
MKPAPAVLFQPPAADAPLPRQADRAAAPVPRDRAGRAEADGQSDVSHKSDADAANAPAKKAAAATPVEETVAAPTAPVGKATTPAKKAVPRKTTTRATTAKKTTARKTPPAEQPREAVDVAPGETADTPAAAKATPARKATARKAAPPTRTPSTPGQVGRANAAAAPGSSARVGSANAGVPSVTADAGPASTTAGGGPASTTAGAAPASTPSARMPESTMRGITARVLDHPGFAPELLALAAVEVLGPRARDWAQRLRDAYPDAGADGLARLATRRFVRQAGAGGATAALAGLFAPLAELGAVLWTQANLVLHLAAAYGRDPAHPDRAVELLVLTRVHPDAESARAALAAARAADGPGEAPWPRAAEAAWRLAAPLAAHAGGWLALRMTSRLLPGAAVLAAATGDAAGAARLAARAISAYRRTPAG